MLIRVLCASRNVDDFVAQGAHRINKINKWICAHAGRLRRVLQRRICHDADCGIRHVLSHDNRGVDSCTTRRCTSITHARAILYVRIQRKRGYRLSLESIRQQVKDEISRLSQVLQLLGGGDKTSGRTVSAAGKARMAAAQRARWASAKDPAKPKRKLSAAGRARIAAAQKARWAKIKAAKNKLASR
jgi:hypothetical protein